ncbi:MAG: hypothetical protein RIT81_17785 [Deltaproteobacteria bacterium]
MELRVVECVLDAADSIAPDAEHKVVELDVEWHHATVTLEVEVSEATAGTVLPPGAMPGDVEVLVVTTCPSTFVRTAQRAPLEAFERPVRVELELERDRLAGTVELKALLVRAKDAPPCDGFGHAVGVRLAESAAWELLVDRRPESAGQYLDIRYRPFSEDPVIPVRDRKNLYLLETDGPAPVLWINADHERLSAVLDSRGTVGLHARLREVVFDHLGHAVWTQLFLHAAERYVASGECVHEWQDVVLDRVLADVYPDDPNTAVRRDRLVADFEELPTVLRRLDAALQRRDDLAGHLTKLVEEGRS